MGIAIEACAGGDSGGAIHCVCVYLMMCLVGVEI